MPSITCPQCHASFHIGLLYIELESCPRCGASLHPARRNFRDQVRSTVFRRQHADGEVIDWETITGSQYAGRQYVSRADRAAEVHNDRTPA